MSSMSFVEKQLFEKLFEMESGYILDFSNSSIQAFLNDYEIDLSQNKYDKYGSSKAKRMRALWEVEDDAIVATILNGLLEYATSKKELSGKDIELAHKCIKRLHSGEDATGQSDMTPSQEQVINQRIWNNGKFRVFLSHKSEFKVETAKLKEELAFFGASSFVAHEDIEPTREWQDEIENALHTMDVLVALMTEGFKNSDWTNQEIGFAMGRKIPVVSVRMGTDPYGFIGKYQGIPSDWKNASLNIMRILMSNEKMIDSFINTMAECGSFDCGNKLAECLPFIHKLSNSQITNIINVFNENGQLRDSFGFNGLKSDTYGQGLAFHLSRISSRDYKLNHDYLIIRGL